MDTTMTSRTRKPKTRRVALAAPLPLSPSRREILELLHEYEFLTPRLLAVAYGQLPGRNGGGYWHILTELRRLYDAEFVERFPHALRPAGEGSEEFVYTLTAAGARAILDSPIYEESRNRISKRAHHGRRNFDHAVALATLRLVLQHGPGPWRVVEFRGDTRALDGRLRARVGSRTLSCWPDASVTIEHPGSGPPGERRALFHFELDLTHRTTERLRERFAVYAAHLSERNQELERLRQRQERRPYTHVAAVFLAPTEGDRERHLGEAAEVLNDREASRAEQDRFLFWNMEDWYEERMFEAKRRASDPTPRRWTTRVLRDPKQILSEPGVANVRGHTAPFGRIG